MAEYDRNYSQVQTGTRTGTAEVDAGLRSYMLSVYNLMSLGVAFTAIVTLFMANNPALLQAVALGPMKWVLFAGILGLGFFGHKLIFSGSRVMAHLAFWAYAGMWGAFDLADDLPLYGHKSLDRCAGVFDYVRHVRCNQSVWLHNQERSVGIWHLLHDGVHRAADRNRREHLPAEHSVQLDYILRGCASVCRHHGLGNTGNQANVFCRRR